MNSFEHFLAVHGIKLLILAIAGWGHFQKNRARNAAKAKKIAPQRSGPAPQPMKSQNAPPQTMAPQQGAKPIGKPDASPWANNDSPFDS